ncbi:MAG: lysophospholipid acyltransferase family protein [Hydrogenophilus sp.]|nr:lysophospholipid acyltransferase family protein [Hydrogenophilus sp.]
MASRKDVWWRNLLFTQIERTLIALVALIHPLPLALQAPLGEQLGLLLYRLARRRRAIAARNLALCFPEYPPQERHRLLIAHFRLLGRSLLERGIAWFSPPHRLRALVTLHGWHEHVLPLLKRRHPLILVAPHFLGFDLIGTRLTLEADFVSIYSRQRRHPLINRWLLHGRTRFGHQLLIARQDGVRPVLRALRQGHPLYYLPDLDLGRQGSVFVPFFGVPAATVTALSRLARLTGAAVLLCTAEMLPAGRGYRATFSPPWSDFPSGDEIADAARMNAEIERAIRRLPEQYYWVHRRFKTRPPGAPSLY